MKRQLALRAWAIIHRRSTIRLVSLAAGGASVIGSRRVRGGVNTSARANVVELIRCGKRRVCAPIARGLHRAVILHNNMFAHKKAALQMRHPAEN